MRKITTFDYAIMIGAKDDKVKRIESRAKKIAPRDNVYLEYGLFSGILSPRRVLLLIHKDCAPATDLSGMSLGQYTSDEEAILLSREWIRELSDPSVPRNIGRKDVEILPTVGIAVGYFYNFVSRFLKALQNSPDLRDAQKPKLQICIPDFVYNDVSYYKTKLIEQKGLQQESICDFRILVDPSETAFLSMYDVPDTILALFKTVDYIFENTLGDTEDTLCAKHRALNNFYDNLYFLIQADPFARDTVVLTRYSEGI